VVGVYLCWLVYLLLLSVPLCAVYLVMLVYLVLRNFGVWCTLLLLGTLFKVEPVFVHPWLVGPPCLVWCTLVCLREPVVGGKPVGGKLGLKRVSRLR